MSKIYIKPVTQNKDKTINYYLNLIIQEITNNLNCNAMNYEITEFNDKNQNNNFEEIFLEFEFSDKNNNNSQEILICIPRGNPYYNRLANCLFKNINKILRTKIINSSDINNIIINFGNSKSEEDVKNIRNYMEEISQEIIMSLDEYFGMPFVACNQKFTITSIIDKNIYQKPCLSSNIMGNIAPGENMNIIGQWENWYVISKNNVLGYVSTQDK